MIVNNPNVWWSNSDLMVNSIANSPFWLVTTRIPIGRYGWCWSLGHHEADAQARRASAGPTWWCVAVCGLAMAGWVRWPFWRMSIFQRRQFKLPEKLPDCMLVYPIKFNFPYCNYQMVLTSRLSPSYSSCDWGKLSHLLTYHPTASMKTRLEDSFPVKQM